MTHFLKSTFLWQFAAGFVIGAVGLFALTPAQSAPAAPAVHVDASRSAR